MASTVRPGRTWARTSVLAVGGGLGFWVTNLAISLTPVAADYRAALSVSYVPMLLEALLGGSVIGWGVAYALLRIRAARPGGRPVLQSLALSVVALGLVTVLVEVPAKFLVPTSRALHYFLIGTAFNGLRILVLGAVIGCLCERLDARPSGWSTR